MTILDPVETIPPVVRQTVPYAKWQDCYQAAINAKGLWVPIQLSDRVQARNLAYVAKNQQGMESEVRGTVTFLRVSVGSLAATGVDAASSLVHPPELSHDEGK